MAPSWAASRPSTTGCTTRPTTTRSVSSASSSASTTRWWPTRCFDAAGAWVRERGLTTLRGPASFSVNDECGLLVDGFDTPNTLMMPHNPPYYPTLLESAGFKKAKDLLVYRGGYESCYIPVPERLARGTEVIRKRLGITLRPLDMKRFEAEVETDQAPLQQRLGKELGLRPHDRPRDRPPGQAVQAGGQSRPGPLRREGRQGDRLRPGAAGLQPGPADQPQRPDLSRRLSSCSGPSSAGRSAAARILLLGIVPEWRGKGIDCDAVSLDLDHLREVQHHLGRGGAGSSRTIPR